MNDHLLSAAAAATRLGVKRATLYAYVSRGLLHVHTRAGHRGSWFDPVEVDALVRRARGPADRRPELSISSAVTLIEAGSYWYRGLEPAHLARECSYESVAELLWTGRDPFLPVTKWPMDEDAARRARAAQDLLPADAPPADRLRVVVGVLGATDPLRFDLRPEGATATARRLMAATMAALPGRRTSTVAERIVAWLGPRTSRPEVLRAVNAALIVMADHELAGSTLAVRVAASFKADPYAAVSAGLGAVAGAWHGAASRQVEQMLDRVAHGERAKDVLGRALGADHAVAGFGQPLYREGDPRTPILLGLARQFGPTAEGDALAEVARVQGMPTPNVDFGLAVLARALALRSGAGEAIFCVGRLAGWLAHAIEEYGSRSQLRPRALYVGRRPEPARGQ